MNRPIHNFQDIEKAGGLSRRLFQFPVSKKHQSITPDRKLSIINVPW